MDEKLFDQKIKEAIIKGTDTSLNLKKDIWNNIETKIEFYINQKEVKTMKKNKKSTFAAIALTAAAFVIAFMATTSAGRAAVARIKEILAPEKTIVQDIEGQKEDTKVNLSEGMGYVIYIDENIYQLVKQDGKDRIVPKLKADGSFPEIYLEIQLIKDRSPDDMAVEIETELKSLFETVENHGLVDDPVKSISLYARSGLKPDATIVRYNLVDDKQGGTYVIKQQYFLEAEEGHGARFYHMLKDFKVVPSQE